MFFLFPIGHEDSTVSRHPWVSYSIIALNATIFFFFTYNITLQEDVQKQTEEIFEYVIDHPHVGLPSELQSVFPENLLTEYDHYKNMLQASTPAPYRGDRTADQRHLEKLTDQLLILYQRDTYRRWGYIPSRDGHWGALLTNLFVHGGLRSRCKNRIVPIGRA